MIQGVGVVSAPQEGLVRDRSAGGKDPDRDAWSVVAVTCKNASSQPPSLS